MWTLEIHLHWVNAVDLLVSIALSVSHGHDQHQELGMLLGNLRQELDEVEGPISPRVLLRVRQSIEPGLKLIQKERRRLLLQELQDERRGRDFGLLAPLRLPHTAYKIAGGMPIKEKIPEELVFVLVEALTDHFHSIAQW